MPPQRRFLLVLVILAFAAISPARAAEVNLYAAREPGLINPLLARFTAQTGIKVNTVFLATGLPERLAAEGASSPADMVMAVDVATLLDLPRRNLTQPIPASPAIAAVPAQLRDPDGHWVALSLRARAILVAKGRVTDPPQTYEALADPRWRGKLCMRAGNHPYNTALFAAKLARSGEAATLAMLTGYKANLARRPAGGDRDVARDILAGTCDVGLINTYYVALMRAGAGGPDQQRWGEAVDVILPRFADGAATHVNISGAALARHAPNRDAALKLLDYLLSEEAQHAYAEANYEYPIRPGVPAHPILASFGALRLDPLPLPAIAASRVAASMLVDRAGLDR